MAAILQDVPSVFETDLVRPLIDLAEELSGRSYDEGGAVTRAMRIVADHSRGAAFLIADGVVPSNEDRGYILRRIMRRAIQQGRTLGLESPWLGRFAERTIEVMGDAYPELGAERGDDRALDRRRGGELRPHPRARHRAARAADRRGEGGGDLLDRRRGRLQAPRHLRLPLRPDQGAARRAGPLGRRRRLRGADGGTARAGPQRRRHRARLRGSPRDGSRPSPRARRGPSSSATRRCGPTPGWPRSQADDGRVLVKLEQSPFYAEGGGQVADSGVLRWSTAARPR